MTWEGRQKKRASVQSKTEATPSSNNTLCASRARNCRYLSRRMKNVVFGRFLLFSFLSRSLLIRCTLHANALEDGSQRDSRPAFARFPEKDFCASLRSLPSRAHTTSILEFGGVGDGKTLNTHAFQNAIFYLSSFADQGGGQLYVPPGQWLTGSFNLTSHFTLFLDKDAVILGSQNPEDWPIIAPLPSYGRGRELPGGRHMSLINGNKLVDVVVTGDNGTVDGQGEVWWALHANGSLDYTRGHLVELMHSKDAIISNLTFINSPFWNIHPVYSRNVLIQYLTIIAPVGSSNTDGIDPDSSNHVCIEDCYIENGDDLISIKSGWDEYGIEYGRPSSNIVIRRISGATRSSAGIALGSEMSGGISHVFVDGLVLRHGATGFRVKSAQGRGGYVKDVYVANVELRNVKTGIGFTGLYGEHPDDKYNPDALPRVSRIFIENVVGDNITMAGNFQGLAQEPYKDVYLRNIMFNVTGSHHIWNCSFVEGYSESVYPKPCSDLERHQRMEEMWSECSSGAEHACKDGEILNG